MAQFSRDVDLLKWEPVLFKELAPASQTLCSGDDGQVSGTTLTSVDAAFDNAGVQAGHVIKLQQDDDDIDGCYEIVSVDSATQLTVSVIRYDTDDAAIAPPGGSSISYRISTYDPQAEEAAYSLLQYFGIDPDDTESEVQAEGILNERSLRQASVFAVLVAVFGATANGTGDSDGYWQKARHYEKVFYAARAKTRLRIDTDDDNMAEELRTGGVIRLRRG